jgi:hypothetical protein
MVIKLAEFRVEADRGIKKTENDSGEDEDRSSD